MALELIARAKRENWTELDLGNCGIVGEVPSEIGELEHLETLILSNEHKIISYDPWRVERYEAKPNTTSSSSFNPNRIWNLPDSFGNMNSLQKLVLAGTDIQDLIPISKLWALEYLDISNTRVSDVFPIRNAHRLLCLDVSGSLVEDITSLSSLNEIYNLDLGWNTLHRPESLFQFRSLDSLRANFEGIEPYWEHQFLSKIEYLVVEGIENQNFSFVESAGWLLELKVSGLDIRYLDFLSIHMNLEYLDVSSNNIESIFPLRGLDTLSHLILRNNPIANLSVLKSLAGLRVLNLNETGTQTLKSLEGCTKLTSLNVSKTPIKSIKPLEKLKGLRSLDVSNTQIRSLQSLSECTQLTQLNFSNSEVSDLSPLSGNLLFEDLSFANSKVEYLRPLRNLIANGIHVISSLFPFMSPIRFGNQVFKDVPQAIIAKGREAVLAYWSEQERVGVLPAKELKLFLTGNTTVGKSTLAHAMMHEKYLEESHSTEGANLSQKWPIDNKTINIWDFGGQEYFHATHHLLMNDDAVYIVLADPKFNQGGYHKTPIRYIDEAEPIEEDLEHFPHRYWLETIQNHAPRSSAMMIWNKLDQENGPKFGLSDADKALFDQGIQEYQLSLKGALESKDPGWQDRWRVFYHDLQRQISQVLEGKQVIQYWPRVREAVEERSQRDIRISFEEFEALCKADDPLRELGNIVIYLRDMCGTILFFPEHPILKDTVFINPNKINELIYAVLNRKVKKEGGRFDHTHAATQVQMALKQFGVAELEAVEAETFTTELIEVMKLFDIIFETAKGSFEYVAPQYLSPEVPKEVAFALKNVAVKPGFALQFKSFVPRHIVPRFIAQNGGFALDEGYWKTGILFSRQETALLVKVDYEVGRIFVDAAMTAGRDGVLWELFGELRRLMDRDQSMQVVLADGSCVDYALLLEAEQMQASRVKNVDGQYLDISRFSLFLQEEVAARPKVQNVSSSTPELKGHVTPEKNKSLNPTIGIITALPKEYAAMEAMLDSPVTIAGNTARTKDLSYTIGTIPGLGGQHCVALCWLPDMGNNLAAIAATTLLAEYPLIDKIIMVGIAGGVPNPDKAENHVRLGDIVVSDRGGVVQYDLIKKSKGFREHRNPPRPPSQSLLHAVARMEGLAFKRNRPYLSHLKMIIEAIGADRPDASTDTLASSVDPKLVVDHPIDKGREVGVPRVFKGPIASANILLKDPKYRDKLRETFAVKAVEMEGSGIADAAWSHSVGYLVVRGICDYCDSRKGDDWQLYAAAVAAAYTRALLELVPGSEVVKASQPQVTPEPPSIAPFAFGKVTINIYVSCANDDQSFLKELAKCLRVFQQLGQISLSSRNDIAPGAKTREVITAELEKADVVILLVSADYVSVQDDARFEYDTAMRLGNEGKCLIVPVILRSLYGWQSLPFGIYPAARGGEPLDLAPNRDQAWSEIMAWIMRIFKTKSELPNEDSMATTTTSERDLLIKIAREAHSENVGKQASSLVEEHATLNDSGAEKGSFDSENKQPIELDATVSHGGDGLTPFLREQISAAMAKEKYNLIVQYFIATGKNQERTTSELDQFDLEERVLEKALRELLSANRLKKLNEGYGLAQEGYLNLAHAVNKNLNSRLRLGEKIEVYSTLRELLGKALNAETQKLVRDQLGSIEELGAIEILEATRTTLVICSKGQASEKVKES